MKKTPESNSPESFRSPARLEFTDPAATRVCVAGSFNDWRPDATPMVPMGDGHWIKELALAPGTYEYRLVVDGQWILDPSAKERTPNPFGDFNSLLRVEERQET